MKNDILGLQSCRQRKRTQISSKAPLLLRYRSSNMFILTAICIAVFTDVLLYSIFVPVIPFALTERAGVSPEDVQYWSSILLALYGGAAAFGSPLCGWFADRSPSRRLPLLLGLVALTWSTILLCIGSSITVLLLGRLLQGLSAALIWTVGLALLADTVGQEEIGHAMGWILLSQSVAILIGPFLGGVVYARGGYYSVFVMAFGLVFLDILLRLVLIEKKAAAKWTTSNSETNGEQPSFYKGSPGRDGHEITISIINEGAFPGPDLPSRVSRRVPTILVLLKSRRLLAALFGSFVQATLMSAFDGVLPLFVHHTFGWSSIGAGLIFLALAAPAFSGPLVGWACDRYGPRWLATIGFILALPFLVLLRLVTNHSYEQIIMLCSLLVLVGMCMTIVMPPLMAEIMYVVEAKERKHPGLFGNQGAYAQAYGLFFCAFAAGIFVGPIWAGFVLQRAGWAAMAWTLGLLSGLASIPAAIWTGGSIFRKRRGLGEQWGKLDEAANEGKLDDEKLMALKLWAIKELSRLDRELDLNLSWTLDKEDRYVTCMV